MKRTFLKISLLLLALASIACFGLRLTQYLRACAQPTPEAYLVLGGNALREVYAAQLKKTYANRPIIISGGSSDPCMVLMFKNNGAPTDNVFCEHCATNTFENFTYSLPILEKFGVHRVGIVTDYPQLKRAMPIAHILFASHGMAAQLERIPCTLGDERSEAEILGLIAASLLWAVTSQVYQPHCDDVSVLSKVDMNYWRKAGYTCQQQTGVESYHPLGAK